MSMVAVGCTELDSLIDNNKTERPDNGSGEDNNIPNNEIWYTTTNGEVVEPYSGEENNYADALTTFGANIISNTYIDGKGVITFDGDVATIGDWAFYGFTSLTSITIPNSVTTIGDYTFASCNDIQNIYFGDNVQSFGEYSFHDCYALTSIYIPYGITSLDFRVLAGCRSLTEVNIPSSVTVINDSAIAGCWELKSVNIPNSVTTIGDDAFSGCSSLESVTIPDSVTTIGNSAFWYCYGLEIVAIGNSITTIGNRAFIGCHSLTSVYCKATTPPSLGSDAFYENALGRKIYVPTESVEAYKNAQGWIEYADRIVADGNISDSAPISTIRYTTKDNTILTPHNVIVKCNTYSNGEGVLEFYGDTIPYAVFAECDRLESAIIGGSVTTIGEGAFLGCSSLTSITIPDTVTEIGDYAFHSCYSLTSVTIFDSVISIGSAVFYGCSSLYEFRGTFASEDGRCLIIDGVLKSFAPAGLTEYTIPNSVTTIEPGAFGRCESLTSVTISDSVTEIGNYAFEDCSSLTSITIPDSVTTIGDNVFNGCKNLISVSIPDSVTSIGNYAFRYCSSLQEFNGKFASDDGRCLIIDGTLNAFAPAGLTEYTIPNSVTTIGNEVFRSCSSLTSVIIPDSVTTIGDYAFSSCDSLTSVTIGDSVTTIECAAFWGCSSLTSVTIGDSVTEIGNDAFRGCFSLTSVYCKATTPPAGGAFMFNGNASNRKIYVPMESVEAYKSASGYWKAYASDIVGYNF